MEVLFVHPNFPGQFRRFAAGLARESGINVYGIGDAQWMAETVPLENVPTLSYELTESADDAHPYARSFNAAVKRGYQITQTLLTHKRKGLEPDIIFAHPGWGDAFYLKDIFPGCPVVGLFEYYYRVRGADVGFDAEFPMNFDDVFRVRSLNATQLMALESCDVGYCPTQWQRSCFPAHYQAKLHVLHDGIDTDTVRPDPEAELHLSDGHRVRAGDEVLTFVNRNLEPYRGYHVFMRALPKILAERPDCHVLIVGGDSVSYGKKLAEGESYKQRYLSEVANRIDLSRVHFTGSLAYADYLKVLQVSRAHVYLTYPFVLSWSMLEAMSAGCLVIGSATPPVEEVVVDGQNGLLVPFAAFDTLALRVIAALEDPYRYGPIRTAARETIVSRYDFNLACYPAFKQLIDQLTA